MKKYDTIIVGAGPAGLSAAIYLGRFRREVLVIDDDDGRSTYSQINDNYLGFPNGIAASDLRKLGKKQAEKFNVEFAKDEITNIQGEKDNLTIYGDKTYLAKTLVLATGVTDKFPLFENSKEFIGKSMFWCITCDGFRAINQRTIVVGNDDEAATNCLDLLNYTKHLTLLTNNDKGEESISPQKKAILKKHGIPIVEACIVNVEGEDGMIFSVNIDNGSSIPASLIFNYQGSTPNCSLAFKLNLKCTAKGFIIVDKTQKTSKEGVYAVGDVSTGHSHQIVAAVCEGGIAAEAINYELYEDFQK